MTKKTRLMRLPAVAKASRKIRFELKNVATRCVSRSRLDSRLKSEPKTVRKIVKLDQCAMSQSVAPLTRGEYPFRHKR